MKDKIEKIIYEWVKQNFGESEAEYPSWSIDALAEELTKHFNELYWQQELENIKEQVGQYLKYNDEYKLTEQQMYNVADEIRLTGWYGVIDTQDLEHYVKEELKKGE